VEEKDVNPFAGSAEDFESMIVREKIPAPAVAYDPFAVEHTHGDGTPYVPPHAIAENLYQDSRGLFRTMLSREPDIYGRTQAQQQRDLHERGIGGLLPSPAYLISAGDFNEDKAVSRNPTLKEKLEHLPAHIHNLDYNYLEARRMYREAQANHAEEFPNARPLVSERFERRLGKILAAKMKSQEELRKLKAFKRRVDVMERGGNAAIARVTNAVEGVRRVAGGRSAATVAPEPPPRGDLVTEYGHYFLQGNDAFSQAGGRLPDVIEK
jgi:hypothetical protein